MGVENDIFGSEIRSGFGEPGSTPPPRIPNSTPSGGRKQDVNHVVHNHRLEYNVG